MGFIKNITIKQEFKQTSSNAKAIYEKSKAGIREASKVYWNYNITSISRVEPVNLRNLDKAVIISIENIKKLKVITKEICKVYEKNTKLFKYNPEYNESTLYLKNLYSEIQLLIKSIMEISYYESFTDLTYTLNRLNLMRTEIIESVDQNEAQPNISTLTT